MAKIGGAPTASAIELTTQNQFFAFQVVQVFLVVTLASAATAVTTKIIQNPASAASLLAQKLPKASNFYIAYMVLQGLSFGAGSLLQIVALLLSKILGKLLDSTPRKMYNRWANLAGLKWGTVYPSFTLLAVVGTYIDSMVDQADVTSNYLLVHCTAGARLRLDWLVPLLLRLPVRRALCV